MKKMTEIFSSFENILILYAPTLLMYITQMVDWWVTLKTFKRLDVGAQVAPLIKEVKRSTDKIEALEKDIRTFTEEKFQLSVEINNLRGNLKGQAERIDELREYLKDLAKENIELKAELRRKIECAAKEPELA